MLFKEQGYYLGWVEEVHHGSSSPLPGRTLLLCQNSVKNDAFHKINESSRLIMKIMNNSQTMRRQQFSSYSLLPNPGIIFGLKILLADGGQK